MNITNLDYSEHDTCPICKSKFSTVGNLNKHIRNLHKGKQIVSKRLVTYPPEKYDHKCLEGCNISFASRMCLIDHLCLIHKMEIREKKIKFLNFEDFELWLEKEQQETNGQYIRSSGWKKKPKSIVLYMTCNRSGKYHIKEKDRKRKIKLNGEGSCKSGTSCTSHIIVEKFNKTNKCRVSYFKQHYGHVLDQKHLRITKSARRKITEKLLLGESFPRVLDSLNNKITRKDLHNIKRSMKIDILYGKRDEDDATSINLWVQECQLYDDNPILYYKKQGEVYCDEYNLKKEDFCLIFMNTIQAELLKSYGEDFICIDIIRGGIGYSYELTIILIKDKNCKIFPVSFMIANRNDTCIYEVFFKHIKKITKHITTKIIMTDIYQRSYAAWNNIMGTVNRHLYSNWQVDYDWKTHLDMIWGEELNENRCKRNEVYKKLKILQTTSIKDEFHHLYYEFSQLAKQVAGLKKFYLYFMDVYDCIKSWAFCYRTDISSELEDLLKSMNKLLEYEFLEGRNVKRLDMAVHCLLSFISDLLVEVTENNICMKSAD